MTLRWRKQMKTRNFNWDAYLEMAAYRDVVDCSPSLSLDCPPTMYSPDRTLLYLSSLDVDVSTEDVTELKQLLRMVLNTYSYSNKPGSEKKRLAAMTDCYEICGLLVNSGEDSDDYLDPDSLLSSAVTL